MSPKAIQVRQMRRKWGSCSTRGWVTFAADLLRQHPEFRFCRINLNLQTELAQHTGQPPNVNRLPAVSSDACGNLSLLAIGAGDAGVPVWRPRKSSERCHIGLNKSLNVKAFQGPSRSSFLFAFFESP